jgi:hypothetical protein
MSRSGKVLADAGQPAVWILHHLGQVAALYCPTVGCPAPEWDVKRFADGVAGALMIEMRMSEGVGGDIHALNHMHEPPPGKGCAAIHQYVPKM